MKNNCHFKGKRVAILAPGPNMSVKMIDKSQFDVIICAGNWFRLENQFKQICSRDPDFIYLSPSEIIRMVWYPLKGIAIPPIRRQEDYSYHFDAWCDYLGCNINTGFAAILDVYLSQPKSLYLQGFTFYQGETPYIKGYASKFDTRIIKATNGDISGHNQKIQFDFFNENILPYVSVDEQFFQIIESFNETTGKAPIH